MKQNSTDSAVFSWVLRLGLPMVLLLGGIMLASGLAIADSRTTMVSFATCPVADGLADRCRVNDDDGVLLRRQSGQLWIGPYQIAPVRAADGFFFPYLRDAVLDGPASTTRTRSI